MPSPFPGMDPYIESDGMWGDFHLNMLSAMRGQLNARQPRCYRAEIAYCPPTSPRIRMIKTGGFPCAAPPRS